MRMIWWTLTLLVAVSVGSTALAASFSRQITGLDFAKFEGREVLVIRTSGGVAVPSACKRDATAATLSFELPLVGADQLAPLQSAGELISGVDVAVDPTSGTQLTIWLSSADLASQQCFRFSQPSEHVLLLEVFPGPGIKDNAQPFTGLEDLLGANRSTTPPASPAQPSANSITAPAADPLLAITTVDLSDVDPLKVLSLAAAAGLLNLKGAAQVTTDRWGEMTVSPAGQSLANWISSAPPGELLLSGTPAQIAAFLSQAEPRVIEAQAGLTEYWGNVQPRQRARSLTGGTSADTRSRLRDDPFNGLYYAETMPGGGRLSDVRVTLDATGGLNLYDVLNYLSQISGISLVIDPYTFDEPTGSTRDPLAPDGSGTADAGPGYRPANVFEPGMQRTGTVRGNFVNVPFDEMLRMVLSTHELEFVVLDEGQPAGKRYGGTSGNIGNNTDGYAKPVILITSRERLEQELPGTNEVNLDQFHYADPDQVTNILQQFNLLTSSGTGWYIYNGGNNGGGNNGGGNGGAGGGGMLSTAPSVVVYRGVTREPVLAQAREELAAGCSMIRVVLRPEQDEQYLTTILSR